MQEEGGGRRKVEGEEEEGRKGRKGRKRRGGRGKGNMEGGRGK